MPPTSAGHHVDEHNQASEKYNEDEHGYEVEDQQLRNPPKPSDKTGQRHHQDQNSEDDDRPLQDLDAGVVGLRRQPDPGADHRNREEHGDEVDGADDVVAQGHVFRGERGVLGGSRSEIWR